VVLLVARNRTLAYLALEAMIVISLGSLGQIRLPRFESRIANGTMSEGLDFGLLANVFVYVALGAILCAVLGEVALVARLSASCASKTGFVVVCSFVHDFATLDRLSARTAPVKKPVEVILAAIRGSVLGEKFTRQTLPTNAAYEAVRVPISAEGDRLIASHNISAFRTAHSGEEGGR